MSDLGSGQNLSTSVMPCSHTRQERRPDALPAPVSPFWIVPRRGPPERARRGRLCNPGVSLEPSTVAWLATTYMATALAALSPAVQSGLSHSQVRRSAPALNASNASARRCAWERRSCEQTVAAKASRRASSARPAITRRKPRISLTPSPLSQISTQRSSRLFLRRRFASRSCRTTMRSTRAIS